MYLLIDFKDSYSFNLVAYFRILGKHVVVIEPEVLTLKFLKSLKERQELKGIILSPGPKTPAKAGIGKGVLKYMFEQFPVLGICLGHQMIAHYFGAVVAKGSAPMHGVLSRIQHNNQGLFAELPQDFRATRYHSLCVKDRGFPSCLQVVARSEDHVIMGLQHKTLRVFGVQYHPEAVLTEYGKELLMQFIECCEV